MSQVTLGREASCKSRRNCTSQMAYEQMLLKELPGNNRSNQPMHAVLESSMDDLNQNGMKEAQKVRNHALIHYLASLANSNSNEDMFDFDFVESLIVNGADINSTDKNGQAIFHEIARSWNLDVALFLIEHGANVNQQDKFGRSPLHVAAAVDYAEMVRFLVKNGADINIRTNGEGQMPIHYAAKNDACKSLKMLLGYGANIESRDCNNRTPLQVAAEMNRAKSSKLLVQHGAPAGVSDNMGNSTLSILIQKLPDVALEALDQFHSISTINRKEFFFLNYLEGTRLQDPKSPAYTALEVAVQHQEFDIILHPVMQRLILVKWQKYGRSGAIADLVLNLVYAILWSVLGILSPLNGREMYFPLSGKTWRLVIFFIVCLMTLDEIRRQITGTLRTRNRQKKWIAWRASELKDDLTYCHPRWPQEEVYLQTEIKAILETPLISTGDSWIYFDWFSLVLILATIASHLVFFEINTRTAQIVYARIIIMLLLVLWFRIMKYARPFEGAGPFVVIFGHIIQDILNWILLLAVIFIPYACAFWITFGRESSTPVESYSNMSSLLYNLFSMLVVNDHDFDALQKEDSTMARLLCGTYIGIMAIINLNLLIALLSDTFTRVYGNAVANSVMQRAKTILLLEKSLSSKKKNEYQDFIKNNGSPESVDLQRDISTNSDRDEQKASESIRDHIKDIHTLVNERFGKHYGENDKCDFDLIMERIEHMQQFRERERNYVKKLRRRMEQTQDILIKLCHSLGVEISLKDLRSSSDDDGLLQPNEKHNQMPLTDQNQNHSRNNDGEFKEIKSHNTKNIPSEEATVSLTRGFLNEAFELDNQELPQQQFRREVRERARKNQEPRVEQREKSRAISCEQLPIGSQRELRQDTARGTFKEERDECHGASLERSRGERHREISREQSPRGSPTEFHTYAGGGIVTEESEESSESERGRPLAERVTREQSRRETSLGSQRVVPRGTSSLPGSHGVRRRHEAGYLATDPAKELRPGSKHSHQLSRLKYNEYSERGGRHALGKYSAQNKKREKRHRHLHKHNDTSRSGSEEENGRSEDYPRVTHSDNELIRKKRQRSSKDRRRYYDNWDTRSVKSVTF